jgi:multidrug resistance protein, MATE family
MEDPGSTSDSSSDAAAGPTLYRPPSLGVTYGPSRPIVDELGPQGATRLSHDARAKSREAERELLRESHVLPEHGCETAEGAAGRARMDETSPLLQRQRRDSEPHQHLNEIWDEAVAEGRVRTSWSRETKVLGRYSAPLIVSFLLQYSINVTPIFAVGRIGKLELGAVSRK